MNPKLPRPFSRLRYHLALLCLLGPKRFVTASKQPGVYQITHADNDFIESRRSHRVIITWKEPE